METPMEQLIEYIEQFTPKNKTTTGIWSKAKSLLSKEITLSQVEKSVINDSLNRNFHYVLERLSSSDLGTIEKSNLELDKERIVNILQKLS